MSHSSLHICLLFVGSVVGLKGNSGQCVYGATKAGLEGFTRSLAKEVASRCIRVNLLAPGRTRPLSCFLYGVFFFCLNFRHGVLLRPGFIHTDMTAGLEEDGVLRSIPLGRFGEPEEVAQAALFLLESPYVTGQVLVVDGGLQLNM